MLVLAVKCPLSRHLGQMIFSFNWWPQAKRTVLESPRGPIPYSKAPGSLNQSLEKFSEIEAEHRAATRPPREVSLGDDVALEGKRRADARVLAEVGKREIGEG
jgi:hypothetical protein